MTIKTILSSQLKSLQAVYQIEDVKMELSLILPSDYPSPVSISTGTRVGVTERVCVLGSSLPKLFLLLVQLVNYLML